MSYLEQLLQGQAVEWKALGEIATVSSGNSAPQNKKLFINETYPFCRTSDVDKIHHSTNFYEINDKPNEERIKKLGIINPKHTPTPHPT